MLSHWVLSVQRLCLASLILSVILCSVIAVPVPTHPINSQTKYASTLDNNHHTKVAQHLQAPAHERPHPGEVNVHHAPGQSGHLANGHLMGTVAVQASHQHERMSSADLHAHAAKAKQAVGPGYEVHAHHTPGNAHVMFHATPVAHHAMPGQADPSGRLHATLHPGHNALDTHAALPQNHQTLIHNQLHNKVFPPPGGQRDPAYARGHDHGHGGAHGPDEVVRGRIPIANSGLRHGMTPGALEAHAKFVSDRLGTAGADGRRAPNHVHVTHKPGDNHVDYHITPAQSVASHTDIQAHLRTQGNSHYAGGPITRDRRAVQKAEQRAGRQLLPHEIPHVDHKLTFHGTMPAHSTARMTPEQLHTYADHAKQQLIAQHGLQGVNAHDMVVAATHKEGDEHVTYHTQPKHDLMMRRGQGQHANGTPDRVAQRLNVALTNAGHLDGNGNPWHHAEMGALHDSLTAKGATPGNIDQHINGHVIGVSGMGDIPCAACRASLNNLPGVDFRRQ